ncbi:MAG TPA: GNAT family N-acetyltransferase [Gemmatimonadaceae bacterium]|jgi:ribosomal protein S18 acetylase RimI-like enzyme
MAGSEQTSAEGEIAGPTTGTPTEAIIVRPATRADMRAVGRLGALLVRLHHDFDPQRFMAASPQTEQGYGSFLGTQLADPDVIVLVAERDGEVVGYTYAGVEGVDYMSLRGPAGILYDIVVDPAHRGHGIGRLLLEATVALLREKGSPRVVLSTAQQNEAAQHLFEHAGFRRTMIEMTRELGEQAS